MNAGTPADTIVALATPPGGGALAVVRVSGPEAIAAVGHVFRGHRRLDDVAGFEGAHGWIEGREGPLDEVVAWVYRAPRSYTGDDMVEISCHGGTVSAGRVIEALWAEGARPAEPGEFTRRAFVNGRIDLAQAEAVADLIAARGRRAHDQALVNLRGGLSRRVRDLASDIRGALARIDAHLDFGDDVPEAPDADVLSRELDRARRELNRLAEGYPRSRGTRDGLVVAITGRPNVGKSSLLNALAGFDRAIVHEAPGTTRDVVDAVVEWAGVPVRIVDTAGHRGDAGEVEQEGMERSRAEASRADLVLWVVEATAPPSPEDLAAVAGLDGARTHLVLNKIDLGAADPAWSAVVEARARHVISARTGAGIGELALALEAELRGDILTATEEEPAWVTNERHAHELALAARALDRAWGILERGEPVELAAADLHQSLESLASITGEHAGEDLLNEIFRRFCIGK
jgi:tRNA modification GTPase